MEETNHSSQISALEKRLILSNLAPTVQYHHKGPEDRPERITVTVTDREITEGTIDRLTTICGEHDARVLHDRKEHTVHKLIVVPSSVEERIWDGWESFTE